MRWQVCPFWPCATASISEWGHKTCRVKHKLNTSDAEHMLQSSPLRFEFRVLVWGSISMEEALAPCLYAFHPSSVALPNFLVLFSCHTPYSPAPPCLVSPHLSPLRPPVFSLLILISPESPVSPYQLIIFATCWKASHWLHVVKSSALPFLIGSFTLFSLVL